ncbi:MAG TPA: DUF4091 domain-containing protein [Tepidisphaeraceae bacterium]|jgi:hypothetical protein|nr:DUF4091 domain-containing protein [Tepidisphaeraceae bacterium]
MNRRDVLKTFVGASAASLLAPAHVGAQTRPANQPTPLRKDGLAFWLETSLNRVYPTSSPGNAQLSPLLTPRNARLSIQACFRNDEINSAIVRCEVLDADDLHPRVRRVGFVPLRGLNTYVPTDEVEGIGHVPGLCPDPLFPEPTAHVGPHSNGVFWISLFIPPNTKPGPRTLRIRLTLENEFAYVDFTRPKPWSVELPVNLTIHSLAIQPRRDFPVTHWLSADSIWEHYKIEPCGDRFWQLADAYIANLVAHGNDTVYTPIFNNRHEILPRPAQLLRVHRTPPDQYAFDFSDVRRWIHLALKHGATRVEFPHFFTPAPTSGKYPQRIFERTDHIGSILWPPETPALSETYRTFLVQFLPQFKQFLESENVLDRSYFHCADEPDGPDQIADYRKARGLLKELAPWMQVMDAMSDLHFATERLSDMPIASIVTAPGFTNAGCPAWAYFCCGPRGAYLQRLLDTPLPKIRMAGWLFYKLGAKGFLHWGYNYWYTFCTAQISDPFLDASVGAWPGLPAGDPFVVYPGADGPLDSIRWEVFADSLQDYALLQTAGIHPDHPLLESLKDYATFPKTESWLNAAWAQILS